MREVDRLYKETRRRVGPSNMRGVDRLLKAGHTGIAEAKTVEKLFRYISLLEARVGIDLSQARTIDYQVESL